MATDKQQYDYTTSTTSLQTPRTLDKDSHSSSITIQLPSTSATINTSNDQLTNSNVIDYSSHNHHHNLQHQHQQRNNNSRSHINSGSLLDHCYRHTVATRSFLFENANNSLTNSDGSGTTTTTTTDESPTPPPHYHEIPGIVPAYQGRTSGPPPSYDEVVNPNAPPPSYQSLYGQVREASKSSNGLVDLFRQLFLILIGTLGCTMIIGFLLLIPITMILVGIVYVNECRAENIPAFLVIGGLVWIVKNILNCYNQFKKDSTTVNRPPPRRAPITSSTAITTTNRSTAINVHSHSQQSQPLNEQVNSDRATAIQNSQITAQNSTSATTTRTRISSTVRNQHNVSRIRQPTLIGITSYKCESMLNYFLIVWFLAGCIVVYRIYEPDYDNPLSSSYCNRTVYLYAFWLMTSAFIIMAIILSCLCCLMASSLMSCNHIGR